MPSPNTVLTQDVALPGQVVGLRLLCSSPPSDQVGGEKVDRKVRTATHHVHGAQWAADGCQDMCSG